MIISRRLLNLGRNALHEFSRALLDFPCSDLFFCLYSGGIEVRNSRISGNFFKDKVFTCAYALGTNKIECKNEQNQFNLRICNEILIGLYLIVDSLFNIYQFCCRGSNFTTVFVSKSNEKDEANTCNSCLFVGQL